jgi:hypothetical protein
MSHVEAVTVVGTDNSTQPPPPATRVAAVVSSLMGVTGMLYWVPALAGVSPSDTTGEHPVAFIQRVLSVAQHQYTPEMKVIIPIMGAVFTLASALQIPGGIGTLLGQRWAMLLLRTVAYAKVAMYIASGLLLGLAIFSSVEANRPSWTFAAINWVAGLSMIGIYYWIILAINTALARGQADSAADDLADDDAPPPADFYPDAPRPRY